MELLTAGHINQKEASKLYCNSGRSDTGSAADMVDIVFGGFWQAEVDHI